MTKPNRSGKVKVNFWVTPEELEAWRSAAERDHRTLSNWVRVKLDDSAEVEEEGRFADARFEGRKAVGQ